MNTPKIDDLLSEHSIEVPVANTGATLYLFTRSGLEDFLDNYRRSLIQALTDELKKAAR